MKRLFKSEDEKMISGVCGGIGVYLKIDPTVIRILFTIAAFFGGIGILAYIIMVFIIPKETDVIN